MSLVMLVSQRLADAGAAGRQRADRAVRLARGVRRGDDLRRGRHGPGGKVLPETQPPGGAHPVQPRRPCCDGFGRSSATRRFLGLTFIGGLGMSSFFAFLASSSFLYIDHFGLTPTRTASPSRSTPSASSAPRSSPPRLGARHGMGRVIRDRGARLRLRGAGAAPA